MGVWHALQIIAAGLATVMVYSVITQRKVVEITDDVSPKPLEFTFSRGQLEAGERGKAEADLRKQNAPQTLV